MDTTLESVRYKIKKKDHLFRRGVHLISGLVVVYYLFPEELLYLPTKLWLILILGLVPLVIELIRLKKGILIPGLRGHEEGTIGSYAWSLWTSMVIMLVMPQEIAVPVIVIYTIADPLLGEIRMWRKWLVLPLGGLFTVMMFMVFGYHFFLALFAGLFMVFGEALEIVGVLQVRPELYKIYRNSNFNKNFHFPFKTDDDSSTQLVPALALGLIYIFYPGWFPGPWFTPIF